ncbi:MAG: 30S ribosomal protein S20 [Pseudomonadota bacterium]
MATHSSALKRHRQSLKHRARNRAMKSTMKTAVKSLLATVEAKETEALPKKLSAATAVLAKAASRGLIHKKTASRKISRLAKRVHTVQAKG